MPGEKLKCFSCSKRRPFFSRRVKNREGGEGGGGGGERGRGRDVPSALRPDSVCRCLPQPAQMLQVQADVVVCLIDREGLTSQLSARRGILGKNKAQCV